VSAIKAPGTAGGPTISEASWTNWSVRNRETGGYMFGSRRQEDAEEWLQRLHGYGHPVELVRTECHSRCETWHGEPEVIPMPSPEADRG
jgi:hypothetical protein